MLEGCPYIYKRSSNVIRLYKMQPESRTNRSIKMDSKLIALFEVKFLSRDKVIHIPYRILYICTCFLMAPLVGTPMIPGNS